MVPTVLDALFDSNGDTGTEGHIVKCSWYRPWFWWFWWWRRTCRYYCCIIGTVANIPTGYQLCDGTASNIRTSSNSLVLCPADLRDRFIVGAGGDMELEQHLWLYNSQLVVVLMLLLISQSYNINYTHQYNRANQRCVSDGGVLEAEVQLIVSKLRDLLVVILMGIQLLTKPSTILCSLLHH